MNRTALNRSSGVAVLRRSHRFQAVVCSFLLCALCPPLQTQANPHGGVVVHGDVLIGAGTGGNLQILQNSQSAIIDWQGFSISAGELTQFLQPGSNAAVLNRVTGGDPSAIHGALKANGNVFLINPSGILVGPSGSIDVHGLVLSTLDVDNGEFLARGDMVFKGGSDKGVTNLGRISAIGGDVFLIGRTVTNSGSVKASQGRVGLAAGEEVLLKADTGLDGERVFVRATGSGVSGTGIFNDGTIEGAAVELKAHGNLYALAINNKGSVRATGAESSGGRVFLRGAGGGIDNSGSIEASASVGSRGRVLIEAAYAKVDGQIKAEGGNVSIAATEKAELGGSIDVSSSASSSGGAVVVESREIAVGSTAQIDASGETGGGSIQIGGGFQGRDASIANAESLVVDDGATIRAAALASGNGGQVILWSDGDTVFRGDISAQALGSSGDGGFVEVSGKRTLLYDGTVSTLAANGQSGTLLLDPTNFTITASGDPSSPNSIGNTTLAGMLAGGNVVITTGNVGTDAGDITVNSGAHVNWNSANSLTLLAHRHIVVGANIQNTGTGGVNLIAGWNDSAGFPTAPGSSGAHPTPGDFSLAALRAAASGFGNNGGEVRIGDAAQTTGVAVGSQEGLTFVAGHAVVVRGRTAAGAINDTYAQIGYRTDIADDHATGSIVVEAKEGGVLVQGGTSTGAYAHIGHGGRGVSTATAPAVTILKDFSGSVTVRADRGTTVGDVRVLAGTGGNTYAQIGHGGMRNWGHRDGRVVVIGNAIEVRANNSYAQIGHGGNYGNNSAGTYRGDIFINFDPDANGGLGAAAGGGGALSITAQAGFDHYAQIGHGGVVGQGSLREGNITVGAAASVSLQGGSNKSAYAQLGHGGVSSGGGSMGGAISVTTAGNVSVKGGTGASANASAYAQIGHGGTGATGAKSGAIMINSQGSQITVAGGTNTGATTGYYAMIGHGGDLTSGNVTAAPITINAPNASLAVTAGAQERNFAKIGHGGFNSAGGTQTGNIVLTLGGSISLTGGGIDAYAQIGHGGRGTGGTTSGGITVLSRSVGGAYGNIVLKGGGTDAYAQIGHGGSLNLASHGAAGDVINVDGASVTVEGGGGTRSYAQIGMGGATSVVGAEGTLIGDVNINQNGGGSGAVEVKGGTGTEAYAQIGIGGTAWDGAKTGSTRVTGTAVNLIAGGAGSYAQIGAGGGILTNTQDFGSGTITGLTWVTATSGNVSLNALNGGAQAYAQIGAGGLLHDSTINGLAPISTTVNAANGAVILTGGGQSNTYAQIGVGGGGSGLASDLGHHNNAGVSVTARSVSLTAGGGTSAYTQIGSGGGRTGGGNRHEGDVTGEVVVSATAGDVGGTNLYSYAQIGHGGSLSLGALSGDVRVWASGSVSLTGRTGAQGYAQIGHGGDASSGTMSGDVRVAAQSGNLILTGGSGTQAYAMTGHGSRSDSAGTRQGGIHLFANGTLSAGAGTRLFHQSGAGLSASNYLTDNDGVQLIGNASLAFGDEALTGVETMVNGNLGKGPVQVAFNNNIDLTLTGADVMLNNAEHFYLLTGGSITMLRSYQNAGTGGVWLGAGWTGDMDVLGNGTVDVASAGGPLMAGAALDFARCSFGANDGALTFGATTQTGAVRVGSRQGTTAVAGHAVTLTASNTTPSAATHLGFFGNGSGDMTGAILARIGAGGLLLQSGSGAGAYTQIGHGGQLSVSGNTTASATISVFFCTPGAVSVLGGGGTGSYAHIGHGGMEVSGGNAQRHGDISVTGFNSLTLKSGGSGAYTQIGHGGLLTDGDMNNANRSSITVTGSGALVLESGGSQAYAQIGMGGVGSDMRKVGTVEVVAGSIKLDSKASGNAYTQIGHGGGISAASDFANGYLEGVVTVEATGMGADGSIRMVGGTGGQSYTQIGNGGLVANHTTLSGGTVVTAAGLLSLTGGTGGGTGNAYAQIGTGGGGFDGDIVNGYVTVTAGSVEMSSREGPGAYVQIGSGGGATSSGSNTRTGAVQGDVSVTTTGGGIEMKASQSATLGNFVQIGAGGGGYFGSGANTGTKIDSSTFVTTVGGGLTLDATNASYVQIGAGGANVDAEIAGRTVANVGGALLVKGGAGENRYALVGSGGSEVDGKVWSGNADASVTVVSVVASGNIEVTGGTAANAFAQIGLGGRSATGERTGAILVESSGGSISLSGDLGTGSAGTGAYAQIGHGGREGLGKIDGNIKVSAKGGGLSLVGAVNSDHAYAQIGHGGERVAGSVREISGTICVDASGAILLDAARSAAGSGSHAKIGHGGRYINGASKMEGDITVVSLSGGIQLKGGAGMTSRFAQIGHGGVRADGTMGGHISVVAKDGGSGNAGDGSIVLTGGADYAFSYAMVGHGENGSLGETGSRSGGIHLFAENQIQTIGVNTSVTHISDGQLAAGRFGGGNGFQLIANGGTSFDNGSALRGVPTMANGSFGTGPVNFAFSNAIDIVIGAGKNRSVDTSDGFHMLTGGSIAMLSGYQNAGSGGVTLVAGWNGVGSAGGSVTFNGTGYCDPAISAGAVAVDFTNCAVTGNNSKTVTLGAANQTNAVRVGSRQGVTSVAGHGLTLYGSTTTTGAGTQLGFYGAGTGTITGAIDVRLKAGGLEMRGGVSGSYAQIGHGGYDSVGLDVTSTAKIDVVFCSPGSVLLQGGTGSNAYAQIGHGGVQTGTNVRNGDVSVTGFQDLTLNGGGTTGAYAQIGNGGHTNTGSITSHTTVTGTGLITLGSTGAAMNSQIGAGGSGAVGTKTGNVTVTGGSLVMQGGGSAVQIGNGGAFIGRFATGTLNGTVTVTTTGAGVTGPDAGQISMTGGGTTQAYVQIGNGGLVSDGSMTGPTFVNASGALTMKGGMGGDNAYVQIGIGGAGVDGVMDGDVSVTAASISMTSGLRSAYAQIGQGGGVTGGEGGNARLGKITGNVTVNTTAGGIEMKSEGIATTVRNYVQIGAGGGGNAVALNGGAGNTVTSNTTVTTVGGGLTMSANNADYIQIGAGGRGFTSSGITGGVDVTVGGAVTMTGGNLEDRYVQIGNGGSFSNALIAGLVSVKATGAVSLTGGSSTHAYAQIGHGGRSRQGAVTASPVMVQSGGLLTLKGGGVASHAQIGHGGHESSGSVTGAVTVTSVGTMRLEGGASNSSHARIGHGGRLSTGDKTGDIKASVTNGDLELQGSTGQYAYAQIGHGATFDMDTAVKADGSICVDVAGKISLGVSTAGGSAGGHAQIGHGARRMVGDHTGSINVVSGTSAALGGGIELRGAYTSAASRFAQIGHGGVYSGGAMDGDISVVSLNGGSVTLVGGTEQIHSAAMIGHGESGTSSTGTRKGGIHIFADGRIETIGAYTSVTHITGSAATLNATDYLGGNGFQLIANGGTFFRDQANTVDINNALRGVPTMVNGSFGTGPVNFAFSNAIDIVIGAGKNRSVNTSDGFRMMTGGSITMLSGYQNAGSGSVTLVAGWNGVGSAGGSVTFNGTGYCDPVISAGGVTVDFTNCVVTGNNGKTVTLGATNQTNAVRVGSRQGATSVAGYGLTLNSSTTTASTGTQLGFYGNGSGDASGAINVRLKAGGLRLNSGSQTGSYTQIGHGGLGSTAGNTTSAATIAISFCDPGDVVLNGSTGTSAYAQIGHGGRSTSGTRNGAISITGFRDLDLNGGSNANYGYAQIGHGGANSNFGTTVNGATITLSGSGNATIDGGGQNTHAMIGHGGNTASGVVTNSGIYLDMVGGIALTGGNTQESAAQIGHGGHNTLNLRSVDSVIRINQAAGTGTGDIVLQGGATNTHAMIGHGGSRSDSNQGSGDNSASGDIEILRAANVRVLGGNNTDGVAQIGHGGERSTGAHSGNIVVTTAGEIEVRGGTGGNYALGKIGHGGALHRGAAATDPSGAKGGSIALNAGGAVTVAAGSAAYAAAQVGHGGTLSRGDFSGTITVNAAGEVKVSGGGSEAHAQIGHVGNAGTARDNVTVTTTGGAVTLTGGASTGAHAQIGHGGVAGLDLFGETSVTGTSVGLKVGGGSNAYARIGHGGGVNQAFASTTSTLVNATAGGVTLDATGGGGNAYVQIGAGGLGGGGAITGTRVVSTQVTATGAIRLMGGTAGNASAMIGNGGAGRDSAQTSSGTGVVGSAVSLEAASGGSGFVQIGAGGGYTTSGNEVTANLEGDVSVEATSGSIALLGGGSRAYAQIGNGGLQFIGNAKGSLQIVSAGDLLVEGGSVLGAYALVGHGGYLENGNLTTGTREGDVLVDVKGMARLRDNGSRSFLTHQGAGGVVGASRLALVADQLDLTGSTANVATWIGSMANTGSVEIGITGGDLRVEGPAALFSSGYGVDLVASGKVDVLAAIRNAGTGAVNVAAGWDGTTGLVEDLHTREFPPLHALSISFADILADDASWGNGGGKVSVGDGAQTAGAAVGSAGGATTVLGHAVDVRGGGGGGYALIGALPASGVSPTGGITVMAKEGGVAVEAGNGTSAYAQIGHRAQGSLASTLSGRILVDSGAGLALKGGAGLLSYVQIGHGGSSSNVGTIDGTVTVNVADDIDVIGGSGSGAYAQIGHGGLFTKGSMADDISVDAGGDILLSSSNPGFFAYAKIGHGDDVRGGGGTGDREGDIVLAAGRNIELEGALVGHVNGSSPATAVAGSHTWIGAARTAPGDPSAGRLKADASSEFSGADEVRFYVPRRANNEVAAGAKINGENYDGGVSDPWPVQRPDEFTNYTLYEDGTLDNSLSQHDNTLGDGPLLNPNVAGRYAFHYDLIEIGTPPAASGGPGAGSGSAGGGSKLPTAPDWRLLPDDRAYDEWLRAQEREYSRWGGYGIYYEGYSQYGPHGESVYQWGR